MLALDPHHTPQEIGQFLEQVMGYHALAYGYEVGNANVRCAGGVAARFLAQGMRNDLVNIRGVVRLAVELYDFCSTCTQNTKWPRCGRVAWADEMIRPLKFRLPHTWTPFFARHGSFTPVQEAAIPPILDGYSTRHCRYGWRQDRSRYRSARRTPLFS